LLSSGAITRPGAGLTTEGPAPIGSAKVTKEKKGKKAGNLALLLAGKEGERASHAAVAVHPLWRRASITASAGGKKKKKGKKVLGVPGNIYKEKLVLELVRETASLQWGGGGKEKGGVCDLGERKISFSCSFVGGKYSDSCPLCRKEGRGEREGKTSNVEKE